MKKGQNHDGISQLAEEHVFANTETLHGKNAGLGVLFAITPHPTRVPELDDTLSWNTGPAYLPRGLMHAVPSLWNELLRLSLSWPSLTKAQLGYHHGSETQGTFLFLTSFLPQSTGDSVLNDRHLSHSPGTKS
jgi:hypothetical protein